MPRRLLLLLLLPKRSKEVVEINRRRVDPVRVDKVCGDVTREKGVRVRGGQALQERVETNLVDEDFGERAAHDGAAELLVVVEGGLLHLVLKLHELAGEVVREAGGVAVGQ